MDQIVKAQKPASEMEYVIVDVTSPADLPSPSAVTTMDWAVPPRLAKSVVVGPGDVLSIEVFEIGTRLFGAVASSNAAQGVAVGAPAASGEALPPVEIDDQGTITLPYVGRLHVSGLSANEIESVIERSYRGYSQALRAMVSIKSNVSNQVIVTGMAGRTGRFALTSAHERLLDVLADAGNASGRPADVVVKLTRGGTISSTSLREILDNPYLNVVLQPGDLIEVEAQPRTYLVLGASAKVSQVPFDATQVSLAEAIARAGGPEDQRADPTGVFLFRANTSQPSKKPTIYRINLNRPDSYFFTQNFYLENKDVLYFANARSNSPSKFVQILNQLFSPLVTLRVLAN